MLRRGSLYREESRYVLKRDLAYFARLIKEKDPYEVAFIMPPFDNTEVGKLKRRLYEASDAEIDGILKEYNIPSPSELGKAGSYIQTTVREQVIEERRKNDIVLIPIGSTENHGKHLPTGTDTLFVTQIAEGVRRYTAKKGRPVSIVQPPVHYGAHPGHHLGMPGTVIISEDKLKEQLIEVMAGLWNDGWRKQILLNNHGHYWVLQAAVQQFQKRYQLPGFFMVFDWHRVVREFFRTKERGGELDTDFVHADESETSLALLLFPDMVNMKYAVDTELVPHLPDGHFDKAVDGLARPAPWSAVQGNVPLEIRSTPEGVVGKATRGAAQKAKRPVAAISSYLSLLINQILKKYPSGKLPPASDMVFRSVEDMEPFLREPESDGWKPITYLPRLCTPDSD